MKIIAVATVALAAVCVCCGVMAAGSYDGNWVGTAPEFGDCGVLTVTIVVHDNQITGTVNGKHGNPTIFPTAIGADGTARIMYMGQTTSFTASVRFSGDQFTGNFGTFCGLRAVTGKRSPN
jgi:hypothetical protein